MAKNDKLVQEELRLYISSLEDQLRKIQNESDMNFLRQSRFALFLEQQQDRYLQTNNLLAAKEFESLDSKDKLKADLKRIQQENQCVGLDYKGIIEQGLESVDELSRKIEGRMSVNKTVQDNERLLGEENFFLELAKRDAINNEFFGDVKKLPYEKKLSENSSKFCDEMYNFSSDKQEILKDIWNFDKSTESDPEIERLLDYFRGLGEEIKKALEKKRDEIAALKKEKEMQMSELKKFLKKNAELEKIEEPKKKFSFKRQTESNTYCHLSSEKQWDADFDNLLLQNYELSNRLKTAETENEDLKEQFWSAYRKIHQDASFEAFLWEVKLETK